MAGTKAWYKGTGYSVAAKSYAYDWLCNDCKGVQELAPPEDIKDFGLENRGQDDPCNECFDTKETLSKQWDDVVNYADLLEKVEFKFNKIDELRKVVSEQLTLEEHAQYMDKIYRRRTGIIKAALKRMTGPCYAQVWAKELLKLYE